MNWNRKEMSPSQTSLQKDVPDGEEMGADQSNLISVICNIYFFISASTDPRAINTNAGEDG
jgi:hypothetical protein